MPVLSCLACPLDKMAKSPLAGMCGTPFCFSNKEG